MKTVIHFRKLHIICLVLVILGSAMVIRERQIQKELDNRKKIEELTRSEIKEGIMIEGTIEQLVSQQIWTSTREKRQGLSQTYSRFMQRDIGFYTIPYGNSSNQFISVLVDQNNYDAFEQLLENKSNSIYLEGKIIKLPVPINLVWLKDALTIDKEENVRNYVNDIYAIQMVSFDNYKSIADKGLALILAGILLMIGFGDITQIIRKREKELLH